MRQLAAVVLRLSRSYHAPIGVNARTLCARAIAIDLDVSAVVAKNLAIVVLRLRPTDSTTSQTHQHH